MNAVTSETVNMQLVSPREKFEEKEMLLYMCNCSYSTSRERPKLHANKVYIIVKFPQFILNFDIM